MCIQLSHEREKWFSLSEIRIEECVCVCVCARTCVRLVIQPCLTFCDPWTVAHQAPLSMGFSRQECWVGCHFLLQEIFLMQESNPSLPHCRQTLYWLSHSKCIYIYREREGERKDSSTGRKLIILEKKKKNWGLEEEGLNTSLIVWKSREKYRTWMREESKVSVVGKK